MQRSRVIERLCLLGGAMNKVLKNAISGFLLSYMLVLVMPLFIAMIGFQIAFSIVEDNLKMTHINMLQRSADTIENDLIEIETLALQVANANNVLEMASSQKSDAHYIENAVDALNEFTLFLNYQDIDLLQAKSAYIYFRNTDLVMFEKSYYKPDIFKAYLTQWGIEYDQWKSIMTNPQLVKPGFYSMGGQIQYIFPFSKWMFGERQGVIVFVIDEDTIFQKMRFVNNLESQETYLVEILDDEGEQVWASNTLEKFPKVTEEELHREYLEKDGLSIITAKSENLNWYYVLALPVKETLSELRMLKNIVILLMLLAVTGSFVVAWIQAVKKGKPVDEALKALTPEGEEPERYANLGNAVSKIVKRHDDVLRQVEKDKFSLQKNFFDELLKAEFSTEEQLKAASIKVGLDNDNQMFQTAYIQLFAENDFTTVDTQTMNEIKVLSQLIKNYLREICKNNVWFHKKNYNSEIAIFAIENMEKDVIDLLRETREWMIQECQIEINCGIGGTCNNLLLVWRSVEEAKIALENCTRQQPVIGYGAELVNSNEYYFPSVAADKLDECLKSGHWQETKDILGLLKMENCDNRSLRRSQFIKLSQKIMDILGNVWKHDELSNHAFWINEVLMQPEIQKEEYFYRLQHLCRKICNDNVEKKQEQRGQLVENIKNYIEMHYCESDMGLSRVGSEFRISESYLSTVFKEQSGRNFADYLETHRIQKACELLIKKQLTVNEVAQAVGYNSVQSFRRAFKRVKGVSPKEIRIAGENEKGALFQKNALTNLKKPQ